MAAGLYEQAEVAARSQLATLSASHESDALEVATALDVLVRALILNGRAAQGETLALAKQALRAKEARTGSEHPLLAASLINLGDALAAAAEFEPAIAATERAVALRETINPPDSLGVAEALDHLGSALSAARRSDQAFKILERSLQLREQGLDAASVATARTLEELGLILQRKGAYDRSGTLLRRAAVIQENVSVEHPSYARTLNLIAQQLWFEGQLVESRTASEQAVALAERVLRPDHPTLAQALRYLASTLADLGDFGQSLVLSERALAIAERNFGANHHETAMYVHSLAYAALREADYVLARQRFRRALSIFEARYGPWHEHVATALAMLARADASLGDFANARLEQGRAVTIYERVGGPNHPFVAIALTDLANVYRQEGSPIQALRLYERALAIREKALGPNHRDVARTLADMASTLMETGQTTRAQAAATRALEIWARLDTPDAPAYATVLALYGDLQTRRGDDVAAREYYERAMAIQARVFGSANPAYADTQARLAATLSNLGDRQSALSTAVSAETAGRDHLRAMLRSLPERQSLNYAATRPRALNLILSLAQSTPETASIGLDGLIRSRALVLDEMAARQSVRRTENADPLRLAFARAQQRLANIIVRGPGQLSPVQYNAALENARRESELSEQELAEGSVAFRAERSRAQLGLEDVRASLPSDSALVSIVRYDRTLFTAQTRTSRHAPSYLAFVLRANLPPVVAPLGSAQIIDTLVSQWRADISAEALAAAPVSSNEPVRSSRRSGAALRRLIWDPVVLHLGNANKVFIVTDGLLNLVPFTALPVGQRSYLLESPMVLHYLSAERDLVPSLATSTPERGLLAVGGPSFDDASLFRGRPVKPAGGGRATSQPAMLRDAAQNCGDFQTATFPPLIGTLQEVKEVSGFWNAGADSGKNVADTRVLVGRAASEGVFKQEARHYRVLHLATHGFFLGSCSPVTNGTRGVGGLADARSPKVVDNPLLLSGLAFAGANRRASAGVDEDDGILTAEEVAALELEGVEWAVLSACDTGVGEVKAGEGVLGLRRAFQVAGARTVIMSLWPVDDQAARAWMGALYRGRFQQRLSTMEAVRAASLNVLRSRRARGESTNPFYWAGFVAAGDWR